MTTSSSLNKISRVDSRTRDLEFQGLTNQCVPVSREEVPLKEMSQFCNLNSYRSIIDIVNHVNSYLVITVSLIVDNVLGIF